MKCMVLILALAGALAASASSTAAPCAPTLTRQYLQVASLVDSLRPDKPSQMRVFAFDGTELTAGQAHWMQGQLRHFERLCTSAEASDPARVLAEVQELVSSHQRR